MFSLLEKPRQLIEAALGRVKSDLVIRNASLVDVYTGEVIEDAGIAVYHGHIVRVAVGENMDKYIGAKTTVIDAEGKYLLPGLIDSHVHIESSLLSVTEFSKLALIHGTTAVVADPHEIGNVLGTTGVRYFIEESKHTRLRVFFEVPSCVPAVDPSYGLDTPGAIIDSGQVAVLMNEPSIIGLGEVMDIFSVLDARTEVLVKIASAKLAGKIIDGHAPMLRGERLDAYIAAGISSDHETTEPDEGMEKLRKGMYLMLREGSAWKDLKRLSELARRNISCRRCLLVADDISVEDLVEKGYMDYIVSLAVEYGFDPVHAIQMATLNAAEHIHMDHLLGGIAPGRYADLVISPSLEKIVPEKVFVEGELVARSGEYVAGEETRYRYPRRAYDTMNVKRIPSPGDLVPRHDGDGEVRVNVIRAIPGSALTKWERHVLRVEDGIVMHDPSRDIIRIAVVERHHATGNIGLGFVRGFGLRDGAVAQTIAHDTHNLIVIGSSEDEMSVAVKEVVSAGGGIVIVSDGRVLGKVSLPIAGLVSDKPYMEVYRELKKIEEAATSLGIDFANMHLTLGLIALPVIPELRITDRGLVDAVHGRLVPLVEGPAE